MFLAEAARGGERMAKRVVSRGIFRGSGRNEQSDGPDFAASPLSPHSFAAPITATFIVRYDSGFQANSAARAAFQAAVDVWARAIRSSTPIVVTARFKPLEDGARRERPLCAQRALCLGFGRH